MAVASLAGSGTVQVTCGSDIRPSGIATLCLRRSDAVKRKAGSAGGLPAKPAPHSALVGVGGDGVGVAGVKVQVLVEGAAGPSPGGLARGAGDRVLIGIDGIAARIG